MIIFLFHIIPFVTPSPKSHCILLVYINYYVTSRYSIWIIESFHYETVVCDFRVLQRPSNNSASSSCQLPKDLSMKLPRCNSDMSEPSVLTLQNCSPEERNSTAHKLRPRLFQHLWSSLQYLRCNSERSTRKDLAM